MWVYPSSFPGLYSLSSDSGSLELSARIFSMSLTSFIKYNLERKNASFFTLKSPFRYCFDECSCCLISLAHSWGLPQSASLSASLAKSSNAWDPCAEKLSSPCRDFRTEAEQISSLWALAHRLEIGLTTVLLILLYDALWYHGSDNVWNSYCLACGQF